MFGMIALACGGSESNGSTGNNAGSSSSASSSSSSSGSSSSSTSSSGEGGSAGAGGQGTGGAGGAGGMSGTGGAGGKSAYMTCEECSSPKGAEANECLAEYTACFEWKTCVSIYNCVTNGVPGGPGPCAKDSVDGACCTKKCEAQLPDAEGMARYEALDSCIHCKTCAGLCPTAKMYCSVFAPGGEALCP
jgi:hypothetical protein